MFVKPVSGLQYCAMRQTQKAIVGAAATAILAGGGLITAGLHAGKPNLTAQERVRAERASHVRQLDAKLDEVAATSPNFSVAVLDKKTGQTYAYRDAVAYDTASIVKAQILACMLLRAQDQKRSPSSAELKLADPMITVSDNDATTSLFKRLGGRESVDKCNKRLGLTQTAVDDRWGFTRTTATDQVRLLSEFADTSGPLNTNARKTAFTLMNTVEKDQSWGTPAIAKPGETTTVKNGWDTRSSEGGLWVVNTIGRITSTDNTTDVSVAVLSHKNTTREEGIALVEKVAQLTRQQLKF